VKLASGDPTWRGLTALTYHYETQPLPTPLAWYAHHLPLWVQKGSTAIVLAVELVVPWFAVAPRRLRCLAAALLLGLQLLIALTGNYAFFNLLTIGLCILLLDDATLVWIASAWRSSVPLDHHRRHRRWPVWVPVALAAVTVPVSVLTLTGQLGLRLPGSAVVEPLAGVVEPFRAVNAYGLFAVMTTTRPEVVVEGSNDGVSWLEYEFKYQPGDLRRPPPWIAPFQPRLDWQMWFAALGQYDREPWFQSFCRRLLEGSPSVLRLLARDPFQGKPPRFVRGVLYQYHFSDAAAGRAEGVWWTRERLGLYSPARSISN